MTRPVDHHGFPCPDRFLPLEPIDVVMSLTADQIVERRKARGDYVAARVRTNHTSEVMRGYQWRPADERKRIDDAIRDQDPVEVLKKQLAEAQQENARLKYENAGLKPQVTA